MSFSENGLPFAVDLGLLRYVVVRATNNAKKEFFLRLISSPAPVRAIVHALKRVLQDQGFSQVTCLAVGDAKVDLVAKTALISLQNPNGTTNRHCATDSKSKEIARLFEKFTQWKTSVVEQL